MANSLYGLGKQKILSAAINLPADTIHAVLVSTAYAPNLATDEFHSAINAYVLGAAVAMGGKSVALGVFDANDVTFSAVAGGSTALGVALLKWTGVSGTSPLLALIDTITGFPLATNGGDIQVVWDNGPYKVFSL